MLVGCGPVVAAYTPALGSLSAAASAKMPPATSIRQLAVTLSSSMSFFSQLRGATSALAPVSHLAQQRGIPEYPVRATRPVHAAAATSAEEPTAEPVTEKKKRAKKPKDAPKRPLTAYLRFSVEQRPTVVEQNPGIKFSEVAKVIGEKWRALPDAEKQPYLDAYATEKKLYDEEHGKK